MLTHKRFLFKHSDWALRALVVFVGLVIVGVEFGYRLMVIAALYIYSLGTIIYNGIKLYGFFKRVAIEKSYKTACVDFFSMGSLLYFFISTGIVVVLCFTIFAGEPNIYLLITSIFIVFAVAVYDLIKR